VSFVPFKSINQQDCQRVHEASLKILRETGVIFHDPEALEIFKKHGARVEGETVFIAEDLLNKALATAPQKFTWRGRNEKQNRIVGEDILIQPNVGPVYVQDLDEGRRMGTLEDYIKIMKIGQASEVLDLNGGIPIDPSDIDSDVKHLELMLQMLKHTDKPIIGSCTTRDQAETMLDMAELALGGKEIFRSGHYVGVLVNPLSPLAYAPETLETMIAYARRNQIILLAPCIMAGISGPISLLGTAVLQNVEILAGLTLMQLVNPGTPVVYATASTTGYMKYASFAAGSPEAMMINMPNIQMGLDFYHLPTRTMCGINHSKALDAQAGYETMMSLTMAMMSGAHIYVQCMGVLDAIMTTSYEKIIIDEELVRRVRRVRQGIDTSDAALAVEAIQEVGHNGTYLTHPSTFESFRSLWTPTISDWTSHQDWTAAGAEDVTIRANRRFKEILAGAPDSLLDAAVEKQLRALVK